MLWRLTVDCRSTQASRSPFPKVYSRQKCSRSVLMSSRNLLLPVEGQFLPWKCMQHVLPRTCMGLHGCTPRNTESSLRDESSQSCRSQTVYTELVTGSLVSQRHIAVYLVTNNKLHMRFSPYGPSSGSVSNYKRDDDIVNTLCGHCMWDHCFFNENCFQRRSIVAA